MLLSAAFIVGCSADTILAPSAETARLERGGRPAGSDLTLTTVDVPNSILTSAQGISPGGDIVGTYTDGNGATHGFLLRDGVFTAIDYPGAQGTEARGIGADGSIVGDYWNAGEPAVNFHGYRRTPDGDYIAVNYPNHTSTVGQRILPDGTILGCRHDENMTSTMRGVVISGASSREISQFASMINGGTPNGQRLVGLYTNTSVTPSRREGFVLEDGVFTPFVVPGSSLTAAWDVNPLGEIVGVYRTSTGAHGFLRRGDDYTTIDFPGASSTSAFGINARGDIVGSYVISGTTHGFVARR